MVSKHGNKEQCQFIPDCTHVFASGPAVETQLSWLFLWLFLIIPNYSYYAHNPSRSIANSLGNQLPHKKSNSLQRSRRPLSFTISHWSANSGLVTERKSGVLFSCVKKSRSGHWWTGDVWEWKIPLSDGSIFWHEKENHWSSGPCWSLWIELWKRFTEFIALTHRDCWTAADNQSIFKMLKVFFVVCARFVQIKKWRSPEFAIGCTKVMTQL